MTQVDILSPSSCYGLPTIKANHYSSVIKSLLFLFKTFIKCLVTFSTNSFFINLFF